MDTKDNGRSPGSYESPETSPHDEIDDVDLGGVMSLLDCNTSSLGIITRGSVLNIEGFKINQSSDTLNDKLIDDPSIYLGRINPLKNLRKGGFV